MPDDPSQPSQPSERGSADRGATAPRGYTRPIDEAADPGKNPWVGAPEEHEDHPVIGIGFYTMIWAVLMVLLVVTVVAAFIPMGNAFGGNLGIIVALLIAIVKAVLVVLYFMHVRYATRLTQIFVGAAFIWLGILFVLTFGDYLTRDWSFNSSGWEVQVAAPVSVPEPDPAP